MINEQQVKQLFANYTSDYNPKDPKIALKIAHTYKVAENSKAIAESLGLSEEDVELAWLIGMLHDIGRFEQIKRYQTFSDAQSVDHAEFGADLLFKEPGLIKDYIETREYDNLIETAIREHNKYRISDKLDDRTKMFANIIRDADKIDIFRVQVEEPIEGIYGVPFECIKSQPLSDQVLEQVKAHTAVLRSTKISYLDYYVGHFSLAFELVYPYSRKLTIQQGYLAQLLTIQVEDENTQQKLDYIKKEIEDFLFA
ncbi:HDIG domain-containing protein [Pseudobutyrivibrio sp. 49]|uniref:HD domain-containing protein n=1 Tax=unclassified Pseudobutyrivibrio TaxID=2638619 RepID=UPI000880DAEC|nr:MULTISPECIES: HD domain-containing protein [unclassified Pseudobutyrivibrio]SDH30204.1 HDIG domain-containing protein [Pseudobutyrivibrio sp. 49]SFN50740.1 HDIG domain-containing protein [Pseudobutyrivibrio sp. UC1225]